MPAFKGINLRSGDIAEQLGLFLLQSLALVAPIPRTEDIGVDAVVTLLRKFDKKKFIAEDSFLIQIKSASEERIIYNNDQVEWIKSLELPLFFGLVNRQTSSIQIFSTHALTDAIVTNPEFKTLEMVFNEIYEGDLGTVDDNLKLPMGPEILQWSIQDLQNNDFQENFFNLLKTHIKISLKGIETRKIGYAELVQWKSGEMPHVWARKLKGIKSKEILDEKISPAFTMFLNDLIFNKDLFMTRSLYRLTEKILEGEKHFEIIDGERKLIKWTASDILKNFRDNSSE
ncbi:hypothetical protein [Sphingobacterium sp. WOUb80]|uniref:hypothetical protein n=1 Tax=Sphingobacterium sp. WOUb80 TaxID=3234028 RepID=UPI003CE82F96